MSWIADSLSQFEYPPRFGPEWGSGGIFGLKYHAKVLYYTLSFEAKAHFAKKEGVNVYSFDQVGSEPGSRSGGDTYNAVDAVDDNIYFGGWIHAPAIYGERTERGGRILFHNKYSHIHVYDAREDKVELLWSDSVHHETEWAGEVSEIIYDPIGDRLIVGRSDGHSNLGIYSVNKSNGNTEQISDQPGLKGSLHLDYVCFDVKRDLNKGVEAIQTIDLMTGKRSVTEIQYSEKSVDGGSVRGPSPGCATSAYSRLFFFIKGGALIGDPLGNLEPIKFVRLFDFGASGYSPTRTMARPMAGGVLVAFNAYTHGALHPKNAFEKEMADSNNSINGPSVLLYITPPVARIVAVLGARVTSFEKVGRTLLLATSTVANLGADDAPLIDVGFRDITMLGLDNLLLSKPPPASFILRGRSVENKNWGGIPLYGYRQPRLVIDTTRENRLVTYEYDLSLPISGAYSETCNLKQGRQTVDLSGFRGVLSFKLEEEDPEAKIKIDLQ
ncbi:MAG: DUF2139 domain-containing protein [Thaumarchaeota archaeon]|nr:DUF2139 domain-containing protein [Nitrososphaerota archaeon]